MTAQLWSLARLALGQLPYVFSPAYILGLFFWILTGWIILQLFRRAAWERAALGGNRGSLWTALGWTLLQGLGAGVLASLLLVLPGLTLAGSGVFWLLPVALGLMLLSPRLACFSYAGGLLSVSYLLFGFPQVTVAGVMGLVAVLHLAESGLTWLGGAAQAMPTTLRRPGGRVVGGFALQRFWPLPLVLLLAVPKGLVPSQGLVHFSAPAWWPLVLHHAVTGGGLVVGFLPLPALLGYSDLAVSRAPRARARGTALALGAYSLILLALAVLAAHSLVFQWLAALWGPGGHELVIRLGLARELKGAPRYVRPSRGLLVMEVLPGSAAWELGLRPDQVVTTLDGNELTEGTQLFAALRTGGYLHLAGNDAAGRPFTAGGFVRGSPQPGLLLAPGEDEPPQAELRTGGVLTALWARWRRR